MPEILHKYLLLVVGVTSSVAGLANLLWDGKKLAWQRILAATVLSGVAGSVVFLLGYEQLSDFPNFLAGVSILSGIGGASTLDFLAAIVRKKIKGITKD